MSVGVLALQGDVAEHRRALAAVGVASRPVRTPAELEAVRALVLPGGESTTLSLLLTSSGLVEPIAQRLAQGMPALGTCAGLILLARRIADGRADQWSFGAIDVAVRRNGYGRQQQSFEASLDPTGLEAALRPGTGSPDHRTPLPAVFIRAPRVLEAGPDVEVLARLSGDGAHGDPVLVRQGSVLAAAFHPELTADLRVHQLLAAMIAGPGGPGRPGSPDPGAIAARSPQAAGAPVPSPTSTDTRERC